MATLNQYLIVEATEYEFKSALELKKPRSWLKTVSAFANGVGGSIYFGVSDDGRVEGVANLKQISDQISELIKMRIEPAIIVLLEPLKADAKEVLRLHIPNGTNSPYYYVGDSAKTAYYRVGNESAPAPANILNELILKGRHQTFDALETQHSLSDYSFTLFESTYRQKTRLSIENPKDYLSFGLLNENNKLTFTGALLADQAIIAQSRIFCTRWNGLKKTSKFDALDDMEYDGNVLKLLTDTIGFIRHNSSVKWQKTPSGREEMPDYPQIAVHEALVNAIVHRDYMIKGSEIHIDMYDDRIEVVSPGGMADGHRIQDLNIDDIASIRRNPILCDLFHRLKLMERRGSGLRKILDVYISGTAPEFRSTVQSFIVTLKNQNYGKIAETNETVRETNETVFETNETVFETDGIVSQESLLSIIKSNPYANYNELAYILKTSRATISRMITQLKKLGLIERKGSPRSGYWIVI